MIKSHFKLNHFTHFFGKFVKHILNGGVFITDDDKVEDQWWWQKRGWGGCVSRFGTRQPKCVAERDCVSKAYY